MGLIAVTQGVVYRLAASEPVSRLGGQEISLLSMEFEDILQC